MNKSVMLKDAIVEFKQTEMKSDDYMKLFQVVSMCIRQGSGLVWTEIDSIIKETEKKESYFYKTYPTFESYMVFVDAFLVSEYGLPHTGLTDYKWMEDYESEVLPNDSAFDFLYNYLGLSI